MSVAEERQLAAATLASAVFAKTTIQPDQDPIKEIVAIYKKVRRRLEAANASLAEEDRSKAEGPKP